MLAIKEIARAKINLTLRVVGRRSDGYHELVSLVAFADLGDRLSYLPAGDDSTSAGSASETGGKQDDKKGLSVSGEFAGDIDGENLIIKATNLLMQSHSQIRQGTFYLDKVLPVAAGLGGGSADAAAALRSVRQAHPDIVSESDIQRVGQITGADVVVCLKSETSLMRGIGERISRVKNFPSLPAILANPGVQLSTASVFRTLEAPMLTLEAPDSGSELDLPDHESCPPEEWIEALHAHCNDLEAPAIRLRPIIGEVKDALEQQKGCRLVRLSGSGASCFGLFANDELARRGASVLKAARPDWWIRKVAIG